MQNIITKECAVCKNALQTSQFTINKSLKDGFSKRCKPCDKIWRKGNFDRLKQITLKYQSKTKNQRKLKAKEYRLKNKQTLAQKYKEYSKNHPEKAKARGERYRKAHPERVSKMRQRYVKNRRKIDPAFNMQQKLRSGFYDCLKRSNRKISTTFLHYLGCSVDELKSHLTSKFTENMTWEKYLKSEIVIDHIIPLPCLDFNYDEDIQKYANYKNLRPLWKAENNKKSTIDQKLGKVYKNLNREIRQTINNKIFEYVQNNNPNYNELKNAVIEILNKTAGIKIELPNFEVTPSPNDNYSNPNLQSPQKPLGSSFLTLACPDQTA